MKLCPNLFIITESSEINICPLWINSITASDLPIPLSPIIKTPTPLTTTKDPWTNVSGAKNSAM